MSDQKARTEFEAELAEGKFYESGRFDNEFGETFVVYSITDPSEPETDSPLRLAFGLPPGRQYFVTGDEVDWQTGLAYEAGRLVESFMLSPDERAAIDAVLGIGTPAEQGAEVARKIVGEVDGAFSQGPQSSAYRSALTTACWQGGGEAIRRGFAFGTEPHMEFFNSFLKNLKA